MARYFIVASFIAVFGAGFSARAFADDEKPYVLDGQIYRKPELIENFINVAFSELPWNSDMTPEDRELMYQRFFGPRPDAYQTLKRQGITADLIPWLKPHLGENLKLPLNPRNVLSRWDKKVVKIAIDWPRFTLTQQAWYEHSGFPENPLTPYSLEGTAIYFPRFIEAIKSELQTISVATGLDLRLMDPGDKADLTEDYGRVRFIPQSTSGVSVANPPPGYRFHPAIFEGTFFNGVLFESVTRSYMYGYLLPDTSLSLDLAVCKIDPTLKDSMFAALIHECLVRALGLPSMSEDEESVLSHWHSRSKARLNVARYAFVVYRDVIESGSFQNDDEYYDAIGNHDAAEQIRKATQWIDIPLKRMGKFSSGIPQRDLAMLTLLYCPALKSGMTPEEARAVLQKSEACFQFLERIAAKPSPVSDD